MPYACYSTLITAAKQGLILVLISLHVTMWNPEGPCFAMFCLGTTAKCCELKWCVLWCAGWVHWRQSALGSVHSSDYICSSHWLAPVFLLLPYKLHAVTIPFFSVFKVFLLCSRTQIKQLQLHKKTGENTLKLKKTLLQPLKFCKSVVRVMLLINSLCSWRYCPQAKVKFWWQGYLAMKNLRGKTVQSNIDKQSFKGAFCVFL